MELSIVETAEKKGCSRTSVYDALKRQELRRTESGQIDDQDPYNARWFKRRMTGGSYSQKLKAERKAKQRTQPEPGAITFSILPEESDPDFFDKAEIYNPVCQTNSPVYFLLLFFMRDILKTINGSDKNIIKMQKAVDVLNRYTGGQPTTEFLNCRE
jgi:hypothetical protein